MPILLEINRKLVRNGFQNGHIPERSFFEQIFQLRSISRLGVYFDDFLFEFVGCIENLHNNIGVAGLSYVF